MKVQKIKLNEITEAKTNVRLHTETQIEAFIKSLNQFGQIRPIVVDDKHEIIAGHGLYLAMKKMGTEQADVLVMNGITEVQKRKLMLTDNKIFELGSTDYDSTMQIIEEIKFELDGDLDIAGYDEEVLESLLGSLESIDEDISEYGDLTEESTEKIEQQRKQYKVDLLEKPKEMILNEEIVKIQPATKTEVAKPFVVCPNCGEKIWL